MVDLEDIKTNCPEHNKYIIEFLKGEKMLVTKKFLK